MAQIIHICLSVIDNLGDMGFACELLQSYHEQFSWKYHFILWTESEEKTKYFFHRNTPDIATHEIKSISQFSMEEHEILFLLFHHPLPKNIVQNNILILRIDYLSFDQNWIKHHGAEHISSKKGRKIIEIIPSPLTWWGWLIQPTQNFLHRNMLAEKLWLDAQKSWISIFAYEETLEKRLTWEKISDGEIIFLGGNSQAKLWSLHQNHWFEGKYISSLLTLREFTSLIHESAWCIVRGEVSLISTYQIGTPFLWDMYKERGGWNDAQARDFLDWKKKDTHYEDMFLRLNGRKKESISLWEIHAYFSEYSWEKWEKNIDILEEIEKYIDSFKNSL